MIGDCVETTGVLKDKDGYPRVKHQGRMWRLHRLFYTYIKGDIPVGLVVGHLCNNKGCVNVDHLYLTTPEVNSTHAARDGLYRNGTNHPGCKIKDNEALVILAKYREGTSQGKLAKEYDMSQSGISGVIRRAEKLKRNEYV